AGGDLGPRLVRPMGRRAGQGAGRTHRPRAGERGLARAPARQLDEHADSALSRASGGNSMTVGYNKPLYILPFDHRASFQTGLFGWKGTLAPEQTARVAESKQVVYEGLKAAVAAGVPKDRAGILVDEQFGAAILADANKNGYITSAPAEKSGLDEFNFEYGADYGKHIEAM